MSTIENCIFTGNSATYGGGGISVFGSHDKDDSSLMLTNCTISSNTVTQEGGGIRCYNSSAAFENCIITGNSSGRNGGGIYLGESSPTIINCTISGNSAVERNGGGINCHSRSAPTLFNSILWGNVDEGGSNEINLEGSTTITITYSNINPSYITGFGTSTLSNNINSNPLFVNDRPASEAPTSAGNYHLNPGSPCIDTGTSSSAPNYDIEGTFRPQGSGYDMGAYEFPDCTPGETQSCDTGQSGICASGTKTCDNTGNWNSCVGSIGPSNESLEAGTCSDGIDNDCDGLTDQDAECFCTPTVKRECSTGLQGVCEVGTQLCDQNGHWDTCVPSIQPGEQNEICDGLDNDCDGIIDTDECCVGSGDVNKDGSITPVDALWALKHYFGLDNPSLNECQQDRADVTGDGSVTTADALCIFRKYLGLSSCLGE